MKAHDDSRKNEGRVRVDDISIALPQDIKTRLSKQNESRRYKSEKRTMFRALDLGLRVMEIEENFTNTILNNLARSAERMDVSEVIQ